MLDSFFVSLSIIVSPEVQELIVVPGSADNIEVTIIIHIRHPGAKMSFFAAVGNVLGEISFSIIFENLQSEFTLGPFVFACDNVEVAVSVHIGDIQIIEGVFSNNDMFFPGLAFWITGLLEPIQTGVWVGAGIPFLGDHNIEARITIYFGNNNTVGCKSGFTNKMTLPIGATISGILMPYHHEGFSLFFSSGNVDIAIAINVADADTFVHSLGGDSGFGPVSALGIFGNLDIVDAITTSEDDLRRCAIENPFKKKGSIGIRYRNRSQHIDSQRIVKALAEIYTKGTLVDLEHPDHEIRMLITDTALYVGEKIAVGERKQFEERKVQHRPFFSPISLHPKLARTLVNLSMISTGETLLDPFCGTGGILIEAGLVNTKIIGNDVEEKIIEGCQRNLEFYDIRSYDLFCADIGELPQYIDKVDAIVTDLPYGKSTTTKGENLNQLYHRSFEVFAGVLKKQGRAVICQPSKTIQSIATRYFSLVKQYELRVHRSLTRYISVYQN